MSKLIEGEWGYAGKKAVKKKEEGERGQQEGGVEVRGL